MLIIIDDLLFLTFQQCLRIKRTGWIPRNLCKLLLRNQTCLFYDSLSGNFLHDIVFVHDDFFVVEQEHVFGEGFVYQ